MNFFRGVPGRRFLPGSLLVFLMTFGLGMSEGYRFLFADFEGTPAPTHWDPAKWGSEETLSFVLVEAPEWLELFSGMNEVEEFIEDDVMDEWSNLTTADIRWEIGSVSTSVVDDAHNIRVSDETTFAAAVITATGSGIVDCQIFLAPRVLRTHRLILGDALVHELGHCLGLAHAANYWPDAHFIGGDLEPPAAWADDPVMSYGRTLGVVTSDDSIGASLLRPASGWKARTGSISGTVLDEDGDGVAVVNVLATRLDGGGNLAEGAGRFTNTAGEFVLEGLPVGRYLLVVRPIVDADPHGDLIGLADTGIRDALRASFVSVTAGADAGPVTIRVRDR